MHCAGDKSENTDGATTTVVATAAAVQLCCFYSHTRTCTSVAVAEARDDSFPAEVILHARLTRRLHVIGELDGCVHA